MKKFFALLFSLLLILSFSTCSKDKVDIKLENEITAYNNYKVYSYIKDYSKYNTNNIGLFNCINKEPEYLFDLENNKYIFIEEKLYCWNSEEFFIYDVSTEQLLLDKHVSLSEHKIEKQKISEVLYCNDEYVYVETLNTTDYTQKSYYAFSLTGTEHKEIKIADIPYNFYKLTKDDFSNIYKQISDCTSAYENIIGVNEFSANITHNGQLADIDLVLYVLRNKNDYNYYFDRAEFKIHLLNTGYIISGLDEFTAKSDEECDERKVRSNNPYDDWCPLSLEKLFDDLQSITNNNVIKACSETTAQYYTIYNNQTSNADTCILKLKSNEHKTYFQKYLISDSGFQRISENIINEYSNYYIVAPFCTLEDTDSTEIVINIEDSNYVIYNPFEFIISK